MKHLRFIIISLICCAVCAAQTAQAQTNVLRIGSATSPAGKTAIIPIELDNASDIIGVQFDIDLPFDLSADDGSPVVNLSQTRCATHQVESFQTSAGHWRSPGDNGGVSSYKTYRFIVFSDQNTRIQGSTGIILTLEMPLPEDLANGTVLPIYLMEKSVVLSNRDKQNLVTGQINGQVTIETVPRPDLVPSDVTVSGGNSTANVVNPGDILNFSWTVKNDGDLATGAGWSERLYLENDKTGKRTYMGTVAYEGTLAPNAAAERTAAFALSDYPGISGLCRPVVVITPAAGCGEIALAQDNNTATGKATLRVNKYLVLTAHKNPIPEGSKSGYYCELRRTGDTSESQVFGITSSTSDGRTDRLTFSASGLVRFDAGSDRAGFYAYPVDDDVFTGDERVAVIVNPDLNNGYDSVVDSVLIEENDEISLTLLTDRTDYHEGDTIRLTARVPQRFFSGALNVGLTIEQPQRFKLPNRVVIPDGETEATVLIPIIQDKVPSNDIAVKISATADHHKRGDVLIMLYDDDVPAIDFHLSAHTVSEGAGASALMGTLTRSGVTNNKITVNLTVDGNDLYFPSTGTSITMPVGTTTVNFPIGVRDNLDRDGDRQVKVTATVYISDCSCEVIGKKQASVADSVLVTDNDGNTLTLTTNQTTMAEGDTQGATITVTRNTPGTDALTVTLECDAADVVCPATVTIPEGSRSTTFQVTVPANDTEEGDRTISILARAEGFSPGSCWMLITDRNLPDGSISALTLSANEAVPGETVEAMLTVENHGMGTLPQGTIVRLLFGEETWLDYSLPEAVGRSEQRTFIVQLKAPLHTGKRIVKAVLDPTGRISELLITNNESPETEFTVLSPFVFTIQAEKTIYRGADYAVFSGSISRTDGSTEGLGGQEVEIWYLSHEEFVVNVITNDDGTFSGRSNERIGGGGSGDVTYGACLKGEANRDVLGRFYLNGLVCANADGLYGQNLIINQSYEYPLRVYNPSSMDLHNVTLALVPTERSTDSPSFKISFEPVATLPAKSWIDLPFTVINDGSDESVINTGNGLSVGVRTDEGFSYTNWMQCYVRKPQPALIALETNVEVTVPVGKTILYPVPIVNTGAGETGPIEVTTPNALNKYITLASPANMPSMQPGDTAVVMMRFSSDNTHNINVAQFGRIAINCEYGHGINVDFKTTVVDDSKGNLRVRVQDENTIYGNKDGEHPYVSEATVQLMDYNTGAILRRGTTNSDGECLFTDVEVGYYKLYATATKHDTYEQSVFISADQTTDHLATISYQAITVTWDVVETEVEDQYDIVTTLTYETQVPVPVVRITQPDSLFIYELDPGKSVMYNMVLRNEGLITAQEVEVTLPDVEGFLFTPLVDLTNVELAAEQSLVIPVRVFRMDGTEFSDSIAASRFKVEGGITRRCKATAAVKWKWPCGAGSGKVAWLNTAMNLIPKDKTGGLCYNGMTFGGGNVNGFGGYGGGWDSGGTTNTSGTDLDAYITKAFCIAVVWLPDLDLTISDFFDPVVNYVDKLVNIETNTSSAEIIFQIGKATTELGLDVMAATPKIAKKVPLINKAIKIGLTLQYLLGDNADYKMLSRRGMPGMVGNRPRRTGLLDDDPNYDSPLLTQYASKLELYYKYLASMLRVYEEVMGCSEVLDNLTPEFVAAHQAWDDIITQSVQTTASGIVDWYTSLSPTVDPFEMVSPGIWACDTMQIPRQYITDSNPLTHWSNPYVGMMPGGSSTFYDYSMARYIQRMKDTYIYYDPISRFASLLSEKSPQGIDYDNMVNMDSIRYYVNKLNEAQTELIQRGFTSWVQLIKSADKDARDWLDGPSASSCAKVKLELDQTMVMTRQAFRGTLTMENETDRDITDVDLRVLVYNKETGEQATSHEMQVSFEHIEGFEGSIDGPWTLAPRSKGTATVLFIPTKYAAPDHVVTYQFGGNLYFSEDDTEHVEALRYVSLDVKPSPELDLTYFVQRDVYGDNPLTQTIVEPIIPAEFSVLINNKGKGDATNIRMTTHQPKIIENEKGLLIDFNIESSQLGYSEKTMALDSLIATDFGDIKAGGHQFATWWLTASLLGHFSEYNVQATHVTSYGNPDLSLLDQVTIHELVRSVDFPGTDYYDEINNVTRFVYETDANGQEVPMRCWLVSDEGDTNPDHVYMADGYVSDKIVNITPQIKPLDDGSSWMVGPFLRNGTGTRWYHIDIADPSQGRGKVKSIRRCDDQGNIYPDYTPVPERNYWQTEYVLQNGFDPIRDPRLHIASLFQHYTYEYLRIDFEPMPEVPLTVTSIKTVPASDEIAQETIDHLTVTFSKPVVASTFDRKDIMLRREGKVLNNAIDIVKAVDSDSIFTLNMSGVDQNGYYLLQVKPDSIQGQDGFWGEEGLQVHWMLYKDGLVQWDADPWPTATAGSIISSTGDTGGSDEYGTDVTLTAQPADGYQFDYWGTVDDEEISAASSARGSIWGDASDTSSARGSVWGDAIALFKARRADGSSAIEEAAITHYSDKPTITVPLNKSYLLMAVFKPLSVNVSVACDPEQGSVNVGSGIYAYGSQLHFEAIPAEGFVFDGFYATAPDASSGTAVCLSTEPTFDYTVAQPVGIEVRFRSTATPTLILNEDIDYVPAVDDGSPVIAKFLRSFVPGTWNTVCLPVAIPDAKAVFGASTQVAVLMGYSQSAVQFKTVESGMMEANVPYLIKPGNATSTAAKVYNIGLTAATVPDGYPSGLPTISIDGIQMIGTYTDLSLPANMGNYVVSDNSLSLIESSTSSGRFRAYFVVDAANMPATLPISIDGDIATGIDAVIFSADDKVYTIGGLYVGRASELNLKRSQGLLPAGVYIIGKQKIAVR